MGARRLFVHTAVVPHSIQLATRYQEITRELSVLYGINVAFDRPIYLEGTFYVLTRCRKMFLRFSRVIYP